MESAKQPDAQVFGQEPAELTSEANSLENEAELVEAMLHPYAVTHKNGLYLRQAPSLDAPAIAVLPCGAGIFADWEPGPDGWMHVRTGRLTGWMMAKYLEELPLPDLSNETV